MTRLRAFIRAWLPFLRAPGHTVGCDQAGPFPLQVLDLKAGDVLVLQAKQALSDTARAAFTRHIERALAGVKVLVLENGTTLAALLRDHAAAAKLQEDAAARAKAEARGGIYQLTPSQWAAIAAELGLASEIGGGAVAAAEIERALIDEARSSGRSGVLLGAIFRAKGIEP